MDDKTRENVIICRIEKSGYIIYQAIMSLVLAIVLFAVMALFILALDSKGWLKAINSLLGTALGSLTTGKLMLLSAIFALAIGAGRLLIHVCLALAKNAVLMMIGGVGIRVSHPDAVVAESIERSVSSPSRPRTVVSSQAGDKNISD